MTEFFKHFPPEFSESMAIKMIKHKIEKAYEKCKKHDETYVDELEKAKEMIELFLQEIS